MLGRRSAASLSLGLERRYRELSGVAATSCPSPGAPGTVLGYPACIYGLFMYLLIAGLSAWGLYSERRGSARTPAQSNGRGGNSGQLSGGLPS